MNKEKIRHYVSDVLIGNGTEGIKEGIVEIFSDESITLEEITEIFREFRLFLAEEGWQEPDLRSIQIPPMIEHLDSRLEDLKPRLRKMFEDLPYSPYSDPFVFVTMLIIVDEALRRILTNKNARGN